MRIAFFVNSIEGEHPRYTTTALALAALTRGHDICYLTPGDFVLRPDDSLLVRARKLPGTAYKKVETLYQALQGDEAVIETIDVREIDVLMLRSDPSQDAAERPWAASAGPMFGRLAVARGVLVLNDPDGLALAQNKLYLQGFPQAVRPASLISKSIEEIRAFIDEQPGGVILKPLQGSGGKNVFKIGSSGDFEPEPDIRGGLGRGLPGCAKLHSGGGGRRRPPLPDERGAASARRQARRHATGPCRGGASFKHACQRHRRRR